jgi:hypothetical protein
MGACRTDLATFCPGTEAGGGKRVQCLAANKDKLSPACSIAIEARLTKAGAKQTAKADAAAAPSATAPGTPPVAQAQSTAPTAANPGVTLPPAAAAPNLKAAIPAGPRGPGAMAVCREDLKALCGTLAAGSGGKMRCLRDNQAKLSPECGAAVSAKKEVGQQTRAACKEDAQRLCGAVKGPERRACLVKNDAQLSPACSGAMQAAAAARAAKAN